MHRPPALFDREREWSDLEAFASSPDSGPRLGTVHGRRRQGKSFLLRALVAGSDGMYHQALEEERAPAIRRLGATIALDAGFSQPVAYPDWDAAIRGLLERARGNRIVVLDEFPYLLAQSPDLSSVIQAAFDDARSGAFPPFRLILCGSSISTMASLLTGQRALRGRARLDLPLGPFDFRQAAAYWGVTDPEVAFLVHAVVGGTPGYRALLGEASPARPSDLFAWLESGILNPSHAMFREADYLLAEDPGMTDRALYQSVLGAIAEGHTTRNAIGGLLQRPDSALRHPLLVLERAGFIRRDDDVLRSRRPILRIEDPFLRFSLAILRPDQARFEVRQAAIAWEAAQPAFLSNVIGPHFERLARDWAARFASPDTLGGQTATVGFTRLNDARARSRVEIDVVVLGGRSTARGPRVLAIGEAKGGPATRGIGDLRRLEHARTLLGDRTDVRQVKLLLFARSGFDRDLTRAAKSRSDVELIDLDRLYTGE